MINQCTLRRDSPCGCPKSAKVGSDSEPSGGRLQPSRRAERDFCGKGGVAQRVRDSQRLLRAIRSKRRRRAKHPYLFTITYYLARKGAARPMLYHRIAAKVYSGSNHYFIASKNGNSMRVAVLFYSVVFICGFQPFFRHSLRYSREKVFGFGGRLNFISAVFVQHFIIRLRRVGNVSRAFLKPLIGTVFVFHSITDNILSRGD